MAAAPDPREAPPETDAAPPVGSAAPESGGLPPELLGGFATKRLGKEYLAQMRAAHPPTASTPLRNAPAAPAVGVPGGYVTNGDVNALPQNEPSVAACKMAGRTSPIVVSGANDYRGFVFSNWGASGWYVSQDGGANVTKEGSIGRFVVRDATTPTGYDNLTSGGDPAIVADANCNFFYASLQYSTYERLDLPPGVTRNGISIARMTAASANGSSPTFGAPKMVVYNNLPTSIPRYGQAVSYTFEDKEYIAVDTSKSAYAGYVYVSWTHFEDVYVYLGSEYEYWDSYANIHFGRCKNDLSLCEVLYTSANANGPLGEPQDAGNFLQFSYPAVDANGNVTVVWVEHDFLGTPLAIRARTSPPGGAAFGPAVTITEFDHNGAAGPIDNGDGVTNVGFRFGRNLMETANYRISTQAKVAAVNKAWVVAWDACAVARVTLGGCPNADVYFSASTDNGETWSAVKRIGSSGGTAGHQFMPWITVDPVTKKGVMAFYSTGNDPFNNRVTILSSASTFGTAWTTPKLVTSSPVDTAADWYFSGHFIGDYIGVAAYNGEAWVHFTGIGPRQTPFKSFGGSYALTPPVLQQDTILVKYTP